jgi:hypothetical protein
MRPPLLQPQKLLDFTLIETDHRLAVDDRHRRALITHFDQLFQGLLIGADVLIDKFNALLRKKLFLSLARASARLAVHNDGLDHDSLRSGN